MQNNIENGVWLFLKCFPVPGEKSVDTESSGRKLFERKSTTVPLFLSIFGLKTLYNGRKPETFGYSGGGSFYENLQRNPLKRV